LIAWWRSWRSTHDPVIFAFHGVRPGPSCAEVFFDPALFAGFVDWLARNARVSHVSDVIDRVVAGKPDCRPVVALTFDDGYVDNYLVVHPILKRHGMPWAVYVITDFVDHDRPTTVDALGAFIEERPGGSADLRDLGLGEYMLSRPSDRDALLRDSEAMLKPLAPAMRYRLLEEILSRLGAPAEFLRQRRWMMTWGELRELQASGVTVGSHTADHLQLTRHAVGSVRASLERAQGRIAQELGETFPHFAYPFGTGADVNGDVIAEVRRIGHPSALVLSEESVSDRWQVPRMMPTRDRVSTPWGTFSGALLACELLGVFAALRVARRALQRPFPKVILPKGSA
jgi:peptidoglycan/xylan/chitin deacetylase (PgdA/CDA1 family)